MINPAYPATVPMASQRTTGTSTALPTGSSPSARYYEPPPSRTGWYALAAFFALLALGIGGVLLFNALSPDDSPGSNALKNYVGVRLEDAIADLDELGLSYRPIPQENSTVAEDVVHATDPVAGTIVVDGQTVTLYYNPRQELVQVPNVEGRTLDEAVRTLGAAGFTVGEQTPEESDDIPEGSVIRTDPPAGELVPQSQVINLVVSSGPDQVAMPSTVIGETEADARAVLGGRAVQLPGRHVDRGDPRGRRRSRHPHQPAGADAGRQGLAGDDLRVQRGADRRGGQRGRPVRGSGARRAAVVRRQRRVPGPPVR